ncbi:unnamed protein product [Mytilus coruscus]|uniref:Reverse transcriptase domain-containing protein n=1 Tax=Mytilus coruscus TaxID=42192 RepID=A0A6J8C9B6_MYTCO|nr:unnamed protein product [Mytilus coruscus]
MNPTKDAIYLPANYVVASVSALQSEMVLPMSTSCNQSPPKIPTQNEKCEEEYLDFDLNNADLSSEQKQLLKCFLNRNRQVFAKDLSELGHTHLYNHVIDTGNALPIKKRFYRQSPQVLADMNRQIDQMLEYGIIEESDSEWQSPVVMCKKKSGELRFCVDYRAVLNISRPKFFPLPRLEDVFDAIGQADATIFSTLDLLSGYWQCGLDPETAHKAAFVTPSGVYQWKRLPFGLASAPSSFQHLLTQVLRNLNYKIALVYVDDILIFSKSFEEHLKHLQLVFDRLISAGLTLKPSKCLFARPEVIYLGHKISKKGVQADISKVEAVESFPVPKTEKNVRSFLGLTNYYRKFIKGYSHIATPLNRLLRKDVPFEWSEKCQKAFDQLKQSLCSSPILAYPNMSRPFILTTDASGSAIAYILGQLDSEGRERVIAYGGRSLSEGIKTYHIYLANSHFKVYTDHHSLKWLSSIKQSTGRLARWSVLLQDYSFEICYREGNKNGNADGLSRREYSVSQFSLEPEDAIPSVDVNLVSVEQETNEHVQVTFLYNSCNSPTPTIMEITTGNGTEQPVPSTNEKHPEQITEVIPENVGESQQECQDFKHIYAYLETGVLPEDKKLATKVFLEASQYALLDGVLFHFYQPRTRGRKKDIFVRQLACPRQFRNDLLKSYHELGHFGFDRTYLAIKQKYFFPGMYQAVAYFIRGCDSFQRAKPHAHAKRVPLTPMPILDTFSRWHIDLIGPFKETKLGHKYILIVVCAFSKWTEAFPVRSETAADIAEVLLKNLLSIWKLF